MVNKIALIFMCFVAVFCAEKFNAFTRKTAIKTQQTIDKMAEQKPCEKHHESAIIHNKYFTILERDIRIIAAAIFIIIAVIFLRR